MVPAPSCPYTWDYWTSSPSDFVELSCLMPNSLYIPLKASWDATLQDVKEELWDKAAKYPLFGMLHDMSGYVFQFINSLAAPEEVDDESKRLRDVKPVCGVLKLIERPNEKPGEHLLNTQISHLIGKGLNEFDTLRSSEVNDFRLRMRGLAEENSVKLLKSTVWEKLHQRYPPRLADGGSIPKMLAKHLNGTCFILVTKLDNSEMSFTSNVPYTRTPQQHIDYIINKKAIALNIGFDHPRNYVLKVCGQQEYLIGDVPLIQFLYIQEKLASNGVPQVVPICIDKLTFQLEPQYVTPYERRRLTSEHTNTMRRTKSEQESSWNIEKDYSCSVVGIGGLNVDPGRVVEVIVQAGIFHGGKSLCETRKTGAVVVSKDGEAKWEQELQFDIKVCNIPRMARLCFVVYEISKTAKAKSKRVKDANKDIFINKLAWANTMIFDYKDQLRTDGVTLYTWTYAAEDTQNDELLNPLGTVVSNPNTESCSALTLKFSNYDCHHPIFFPPKDVVKEYALQFHVELPESVEDMQDLPEGFDTDNIPDLIYELHEQDRKKFWSAREVIRDNAPQVLPKLLMCLDWGLRSEAASVVPLLSAWPLLPVESALELLDYAYADATVRGFAVKCLAKISDEDLQLYLLQLVQALKHEAYLMCDLAVFLLERAFTNMNIGHFLFWHLRSEMHVASVSVRFGLVLEAYCRGCQEHLGLLKRQISCLDKLKWASQSVRKKKEIGKARSALIEHLSEPHCTETLSEFISPLNPRVICKRVRPDRCRVMDSKMRPLLLEFENDDPTGNDPICIIMKMGDDLRQDMFTLQMLRIMDRLWKNAGYDFRLNPYGCISMEYEVGLIEVVSDAETIANIQKEKALFNATSTFTKGSLFQWLREHNTTELGLNNALEEFTMSCAGYCVATYVLGIADRHPDNIMLNKRGQLFHIDFGHILGHFKEKFGFKRERVPFVLTHDFIHVINKGAQGKGAKEPLDFKLFRDHCETAFKVLRKHGHLFLSLFSMMISTGLPELSSEKDLQYLRETLVLDLTEEKAVDHFRSKFYDAVKNAWTTSLNWALHNIDKNNRQ